MARFLATEQKAIHDKQELKNIKYWKPQTIGEVLFNHWD